MDLPSNNVADSETADEPSASDQAQLEKKDGFGKVANRVAGWTNNLIATAIIVLIGLTLGIGALQMWGVGSAKPKPKPKSETSINGINPGEWVAFGWQDRQIERRELLGTVDDAAAALIERGLWIAQQSDHQSLPEPTDQERQFLASIVDVEPDQSSEEGIQSYVLDGPVPMVVTIVEIDNKASLQSGQPNDSDISRRVLSWGLAMPVNLHRSESQRRDPGGWTLFAFRQDQQAAEALRLPGDLKLPPGSVETLSIATMSQPNSDVAAQLEGGSDESSASSANSGEVGEGGVVSFVAKMGLERCQAHFDNEFDHGRWDGGDWRAMGRGVGRRVFHSKYGQLEIQLDNSRADQVIGIILLTPPSETSETRP